MARFLRMTRRTASLSMTLAGLAVLGACSSAPSANHPSQQGVIPASTPDNDSTMASALALSQYVWQLNTVNSAGKPAAFEVPAAAGKRPILRFLPAERELFQGNLVVNRLCNNFTGRYTLDRDSVQAGPFMSTSRACADPALNQLERGMAQQLPKVSRWEIEPFVARGFTTENHPQSLTLRVQLNDGSQWTLSGTPNDELRYGGEGQRVFLEVASQTVRCSSAQPNNLPCLQVRTITYDERGLKLGTGQWREFSEEIQGFTHDPRYRQVLRLKHWPTKNVYVLDMVVESEIIR